MKYHIITYGCQMNKSDSERIAGLLLNCGWQQAEDLSQADLVVLNTCSVRQLAVEKVLGEVNSNLKKYKKKNPRLIIAVTGCLPGQDKIKEYKKKMPGCDLYFPINDLPLLPDMLARCHPDPASAGEGSLKRERDSSASGLRMTTNGAKDYFDIKPFYGNKQNVFVPISSGCSQYCTYCVVPYARGKEVQRPLKAILTEVRDLADKGAVAVTLLGQTVNDYTAPDAKNFSTENPFKNHFAALLWEINQIDCIEWINFTAPHPRFMTEEVIEALKLPKMVNYLHLPVQAGSNKILKKMNRRYTADEYLSLVKKIRRARPEIALGTDIIVGFPGETKADFQKTVELYKKADFDIAYLAKYSARPGTAAAKLGDDVKKEEKEQRWWVLQHLMEKIVLRKNKKYTGRTVEILVDKCIPSVIPAPHFAGGIQGRYRCFGNSREMKCAEFTSKKDLTGKIVLVRVKKAEMWRLVGKVVE